MLKYSKKDILNYIAGNDLPYEIDVYEANSSFMLDVIKLTKDKRIYELCDDDLKYDVVFIENLLEIFKKDFEFSYKIVKKISDVDYISIDEIINLYIILINNFKNIDNEIMDYMKICVNLFYGKTMKMYRNEVRKEKNPKLRKEYGCYFASVLDDFKTKPFIKDYFAERILDKIYSSFGNLEKYIHLRFKNKEELLKIGIKKYICNSVYGYDEYLAGYIESSNITLELEKKIKKIINNFDKFELEKLYYIIDVIVDFACENEVSISPLVKYISETLKLPGLIDIYVNMLNEHEIFDYDRLIYASSSKISELKNYVAKYLETLEEPDDYIEEEKKIKSVKFKRYN